MSESGALLPSWASLSVFPALSQLLPSKSNTQVLILFNFVTFV